MIESKTHLFIIGAQKSGTTWLHHELDLNNQFFLPPDRQEIQFFGDYGRDLSEYSLLYRKCKEWHVSVDVTPVYMSRTFALDHILKSQKIFLGGTKYIVVLREPVSRAFSAYQMYLGYGRKYSSFLEALDGGNSDIADKSMYGRHLRRWLNKIARKDLKVLFFDDILAHPDYVLEEIFCFLGLRGSVMSSYAGVPINAGGVPRLRLLGQSFRLGAKISRGIGLRSAIPILRKSKVFQKLDQRNKRRLILDKHTEAVAKSFFVEDIELLDSVVGLGDMKMKWGYN